jgi:type I restriction enzyme, S subunit
MSKALSDEFLGGYVTLQRGNTYKSALLGRPGPVLLGLGSIARNGGFRGDNLKTYGGISDEKIILRPGDIYVSLKDVTQSADLLGAVSKVPGFIASGRLTQDTVKLEFKADDASSNYIYWLLRTPEYRAYCRAHATGTTNLGLSREDFFSFRVPALTDRRATLVAIIQSIDDKMDLNRRMNQTLESTACAIFRSWFVDFDPVVAKGAGRQPFGMSADLAALFPDELVSGQRGEMPLGWHFRPLAEVTAKIGSGATPRGGSAVYVPQGTSFIRSQNVLDHEFEWSGLARITDEAAQELRGVTVRGGDVLLNITGDSILRTCVVDSAALPARVSQHVAIIRPSPGMPPRYLHLRMVDDEMKDFLIGFDAGGTRPAVTKGQLETVPILVPPDALLRRFDELTDPLFRRIDSNRRESRTLAALRDTLLPKLMSGELRVRDAEKLVGTHV